MVGVGIFVIIWPFTILNLVTTPSKLIKSKDFDDKYGTLTSDFKLNRTLLQRAYYPLFIFQRIMITFILVMLYDYPLLQLILILFIQLSMVSYIVKFRPFKTELQQLLNASDEFGVVF